MNCRQLAIHWKQVKRMPGENPGKLTDGDVAVIAGNGDTLPGRIQEGNGTTHEKPEKEFQDWVASLT
jgi:uncharacterized protein YjbJ (UPF0337 family)